MTSFTAALRMLASSFSEDMYGKDVEEMAFVDEWIEFLSDDVQNKSNIFIYSIFGILEVNKGKSQMHNNQLMKFL